MVIEKDGVKYACLPCIRGHRVKKCQHHDRQLAPLSKRGRQVSQCNHCRDLRSSGSHVKCTCASASVLNRLNGCLCEINQTCTCVARHLQNIQTTSPTEINSVSFSVSPYSHLSSSPLLETTTTAAVAAAVTGATTSAVLIKNDPSITNHHSSSLISSLSDPSLFWVSSHLPSSSSSSQDLIGQADQLYPSTMATGNNLDPPSTLLSHNGDHSSQLLTSTTTTTTSTTSQERDLLDIFLHRDIDDLLF